MTNNIKITEEEIKEAKEDLRSNFRILNSKKTKFKKGDKVRVLKTESNKNRYPKTIGIKGKVIFPYYTINSNDSGEFRNYFVRVKLDYGKFASYFTTDLVRIK